MHWCRPCAVSIHPFIHPSISTLLIVEFWLDEDKFSFDSKVEKRKDQRRWCFDAVLICSAWFVDSRVLFVAWSEYEASIVHYLYSIHHTWGCMLYIRDQCAIGTNSVAGLLGPCKSEIFFFFRWVLNCKVVYETTTYIIVGPIFGPVLFFFRSDLQGPSRNSRGEGRK